MSILVTGADGHIGRAVAAWLLTSSDFELLLAVRPGERGLHEKIRSLGKLATHSRCTVVPVDLRDAQPFLAIPAQSIEGILHCAAITRFSVDRGRARAVNIDGTRKLLELAETCPRLRRVALISSLYSAGLQAGIVRERPVGDQQGFANHYEWSKCRAEMNVAACSHLPWQIHRLATVVGDNESGRVRQINVIHNTLRLLFYGLLSVIPGKPTTRVYTVSTDYAASAIGTLFMDGSAGEVFHVCDSAEQAVTLGELLDIVYSAFSSDASFARRRILKPMFCDQASFDTLVEGFSQFRNVVGQSLASVAPFAPQLFIDKDVCVSRTRAVLGDLHAPEPRELIRAVCEHLVASRWGLEQTTC